MNNINVLSEFQRTLSERYALPVESIVPEARFDTLGVDSLSLIELLFDLEDKFDIRLPENHDGMQTIGDVVRVVEDLLAQRGQN